jgi:hypothetical protein
MNSVRASPPILVPKMMFGERVGEARRSRSRASVNRGHAKMTWLGVWTSTVPHWQSCRSGARGRCLALYSPVKACSVRSLMAVQKTGRAAFAIPCMNSGGCPDGGWWRARKAGLRRGSLSHTCSQFAMALRRASSRREAMVGGAGRVGCAIVVAWIATSRSRTSGMKPTVSGNQLMASVMFGWSKRILVAVEQMILHASALSCLELVWHHGMI